MLLFSANVSLAGVQYCHDPARNLVTRTAPGACLGKVITRSEAQALRRQRRQQILGSTGTEELQGILGYGTGLIVSTNGHVLTSLHTVKYCKSISILSMKGELSKSQLLAKDDQRDLALLTSDLTDESVARFDASPLSRGDVVTIPGYPFRGMIPRQPTTLRAEIASINAPDGQLPVLATIRRGHSGSPVLDGAGRVRGIIRAKVDTPKIFAKTGKVVKNIGIAVPAGEVLIFLENIRLPQPRFDNWGVTLVRVDCR